MSFESENLLVKENFVDSETMANSCYRMGKSITHPIITGNVSNCLEGIEFWENQNINEKTGLEVGLDYMSFNLPYQYVSSDYEEYILKPIINTLRLENVNCDNSYRYSETQMITRNFKSYSKGTNIIVNDSSRENEFLEKEYLTRVELKGSGCREFEKRGGNWKELINHIMSSRGYMTILDISIDDKVGYLTTKELDKLIRKGYFTSNFRTFKEDSTLSTNGVGNKGWGYFFGSRKSDIQLRIYDKRLEQINKGNAIDTNCTHWIRYEIRFMHDKAKSIIHELKNNIMNLEVWGCELLKGCINFLIPNKKDTNKTRWEVNKKWESMLIDLGKQKVKVSEEYKTNTTIYSMRSWLKKNCTRSMIINDLTLDSEELERKELEHKLIGMLKLSNVDLNMINEEREIKELGKLSMRDIQQMIKKTNDKLIKCHNEFSWKMFKEEIEKMFNANYEYLINACKV